MTPGLVYTADNARLEAQDICASVSVILLGGSVKVSISLFTSVRSKQTRSNVITLVKLLGNKARMSISFGNGNGNDNAM